MKLQILKNNRKKKKSKKEESKKTIWRTKKYLIRILNDFKEFEKKSKMIESSKKNNWKKNQKYKYYKNKERIDSFSK